MDEEREIPIILVVGASEAGKTTLMEKIVQRLKKGGVRVGTIKHDLHGFEMDRPGKDSWRHKKAGAHVSIISSPKGIGMVMDVDHDHSPLELRCLFNNFNNVDIILAEGYKREPIPKIEVIRREVQEKPFCGEDENLIAVVSDHPLNIQVPRFSLDEVEGITEFIVDRFLSGEKSAQFDGHKTHSREAKGI